MSDRFEEMAERVLRDLDVSYLVRSNPAERRRIVSDALVTAYMRAVDETRPCALLRRAEEAEAIANRLRAMLDEAMSEYPSLRVKVAKALKEIGGSNAGAE